MSDAVLTGAGSALPATLDQDATGHHVGGLVVTEVQPEGKGPMPAAAWANGARPRPDESFC